MTFSYDFRPGYRANVPAQVAGEELDRIRSEHGGLTAALVVDESRAEDAPLHPVFEWNDAEAAERHREHQARTMIRSLVVERPDSQPSPIYVHIKSLGAYLPTDVVVTRLDLYEEAYRDAVARLASAALSLQTLEDRARTRNPGSASKIKGMITSLRKVQEKLAAAKLP